MVKGPFPKKGHSLSFSYNMYITNKRVIKRDGNRCMKCGIEKKLTVHHIIPLSSGCDPFDMENMITLCRDCHDIEHQTPQKRKDKPRVRMMNKVFKGFDQEYLKALKEDYPETG